MPEMQVRAPGLEYSPGGGNGKLLQYSCLGNPTDEEPGRLQSRESQRVQQDSETKPTAIIYVCMCLIYDIFYIPFMCTCVYSVAQLHLTLCNATDWSPPGSSVHEIFQARILEWVAISFPRESSWPKDRIHISCIGRQILYHWTILETLIYVFTAIQTLNMQRGSTSLFK